MQLVGLEQQDGEMKMMIPRWKISTERANLTLPFEDKKSSTFVAFALKVLI